MEEYSTEPSKSGSGRRCPEQRKTSMAGMGRSREGGVDEVFKNMVCILAVRFRGSHNTTHCPVL